MSKAPTPAPKSNEPIGAYPCQFTRRTADGKPEVHDGFAAYDATGRSWQVDEATAQTMGIREAAADLFPPLTGTVRRKLQ